MELDCEPASDRGYCFENQQTEDEFGAEKEDLDEMNHLGGTMIFGETFPVVADKMGGFEYFKTVLKSPKTVVAPMVNQSELPFRMLCRKYGAELCYTPMYHSKLFATESTYRKRQWSTCPEDRPLVVQFCANDPRWLLKAAKLVENDCDAVDINFGCPQRIAKSGNYGAYLMEKPEVQCSLIKVLHQHLKIPVFCKIRIFPTYEETLKYAKMVEAAGCQLLTVHGRTREMKGPATGIADWETIRKLKSELSIPVFSNGNIQYFEDVDRCLEFTKADGVMSAEGLLRNPALFCDSSSQPDEIQLALEYLELCERYPTDMAWIRNHLYKLFNDYVKHEPIRNRIFLCNDIKSSRAFVQLLSSFKKDGNFDVFKLSDGESIPSHLHHDRSEAHRANKESRANGQYVEEDPADLMSGISSLGSDF